MSVKRYEFCQWSGDEAGMQEEPDGEYVKYEDYEALRALAQEMVETRLNFDLGNRVSRTSWLTPHDFLEKYAK